MIFGLVGARPGGKAPFDSAMGPPLTTDGNKTIVVVSTDAELQLVVQAIQSNTTVVMTSGTYRLDSQLRFVGPLSNIELRGATANRGDVVLIGGTSEAEAPGTALSAIVTDGPIHGLTIGNLTIKEFSGSAVSLGPGSSFVRLQNLHLVNAGRQFVRAVSSDNGIIEDSVFELTGEGTAPASGIDVRHSSGWLVRRSLFRNFVSGADPMTPVVAISHGSSGTSVTENTFVNCQWELALGPGPASPHQRSNVVRNNFVVRESWVGGGAAILVTSSPPATVVHNSILLNGSSQTAIEIRTSMTNRAVVRNNLTDAEIVAGDGSTARMTENQTDASPAFFVNPLAGDLHLLESATTVIDRAPVLAEAAVDRDGDPRGPGDAADYGADEFSPDLSALHDRVHGQLRGTTGGAAATGGAATRSSSVPTGALAMIASSLPSPWMTSTVGAPALPGFAAYDSRTFTVAAAGADIWGQADEFRFVYRKLAGGDCQITARVGSLRVTDVWAKAGVMIRQSLQPGSPHALMLVSGRRGLAFQRRPTAGQVTLSTSSIPKAAPVWVRLVRSGFKFSAYRSTDGTTWKLVGSDTISMAGPIYVGLAVTSHATGSVTKATFTRVAVRSLPVPWASRNIGAPAVPGSASYSSGTFDVKGGGVDIWGTSDQFRFVYQKLSGDGEIVARVKGLQHTHPWAKAGVMFRERLTADSRHVNALVSAGSGLAFQRRTIAGGTTGSTGIAGAAPAWVSLSRKGSRFRAYGSADGRNWTLIGSATINMASTVYVGLAVTGHQASTAATAAFRGVRVRTRVSNKTPTVSLTRPLAGQAFTIPASITLAANASDPDGTIARVQFYSGSTLLGSDSSRPYTLTWNPAKSGTYSVTAVALDNVGARTRSNAATITASAAASRSQKLVFSPSTDHATIFGYVFEIFRAGVTPTSATPVKTQNLGKPPVVNGQVTVRIGSAIAALAPGSYFATVSTVGAAGSRRSAPSNTFTR